MAEVTTKAPATYQQPSRKGKKAWRKNIDITDVQQGLEDVRDEIIQGGVIAEKDASELFATDVTGDEKVAAKQQKGKRLLKSEEILAQRSAVPGLDGRKRRGDEHYVPSTIKKQKTSNYVSHKELQRLRSVADGDRLRATLHDVAATHDPWTQPVIKRDERLKFLDEKPAVKEPNTLKRAAHSLAASGKRFPDVPKPDAGKSYNPLVSDWAALLEREGVAAVEAEERRLVEEARAAEKEARALEEAAKVEAAEGDEFGTDYESAWESEWDGFQSGTEEVHTAKLKPRKTPAERNKVKARKEREAREKWERKQKEREIQERGISKIARDVTAKGKARQTQLATLNSDSSDPELTREVRLKRRRFGQLPVPEAPLEVVLPDELEDSLRRLKPEGNLLTDRYRNLLINGKVEVRKKQWQRKQVRRDTTEKWSYKDWKLR